MKKELLEKLTDECEVCSEIKRAVMKYMEITGDSEEEAFEKVDDIVGDLRYPFEAEDILEVLGVK